MVLVDYLSLECTCSLQTNAGCVSGEFHDNYSVVYFKDRWFKDFAFTMIPLFLQFGAEFRLKRKKNGKKKAYKLAAIKMSASVLSIRGIR